MTHRALKSGAEVSDWAMPKGRRVSAVDFDLTGWAPVSVLEASLIESEWGGDVVYLTTHQRQYWARVEDALAARTVSRVAVETEE